MLPGSRASGSLWEWFLLPRAPIAPTALLPLLPPVLPASAWGGSHMSPLASLPLPYLLAQAPSPLPFPTCASTFLLLLFRSDFSYSFLCLKRDRQLLSAGARILHLVAVLTDGSNIACFDCLAQLIFGGMG